MQPPLNDQELKAMFINTLRALYYDRMVGSASTNFSDVIKIEKMIEFGVKNGRTTDSSSETRRMMTPKKKEEEIHELSSTQRVVTHVSSPTVLVIRIEIHQVAIVAQRPLRPPYPKWYDPNAKAVRYSTENCFPLKANMQSLVKGKKFGCANEKQCSFHPEIDDHSIEDCC
ncbi:uncharacterized protein E5676_scaffold970G00550 [Cucumis melo var. makuwa]|uniref:Uncharacterized protein n=1 Tax=Cucumis melo var. makuwa TaxID=1194695 RepID=A0A5D3DVI6_CUCMM|nr:uncharacterized protein E6C27_scaffold126G00680 [Cucumis melo var. makuwa]TYK27498.1 uncharacterized protein E5676_scaffold970G00550 [Cucumis melo var. makuwa]